MKDRSILRDGLYGLAVADALGVPYEFSTLAEMQENPCTDMVGYGSHYQPEGTWSDDTSMALCTADSLCGGFDTDDMMKKFALWKEKKQYTATGVLFDIGGTCRRAIDRYLDGWPPEECGDRTIKGNGNGALMRIFPMAVYQHCMFENEDPEPERFLAPVHAASALTHAHAIGLICCGLFAFTLREWLRNTDGERTYLDIAQSAFEKGRAAYNAMGGAFAEEINSADRFVQPADLIRYTPEQFLSSGYVVNTWNIALWSLLTADNYRDCVLKAVNVGGDTDTNAAVAGALAGVIYGKENIPEEWISKLKNKELIDGIIAKCQRSFSA